MYLIARVSRLYVVSTSLQGRSEIFRSYSLSTKMKHLGGPPPVKLVLVTGGVISGVGKGIISASLGVLLKAHGYRVSAIKIDPYINIDAGTFSPYEHGNRISFYGI